MPQSNGARAKELHNLPEHNAEAAAAEHGKSTHLTAHEESVQLEGNSRSSVELSSKVTHGKAASLEAAKGKK